MNKKIKNKAISNRFFGMILPFHFSISAQVRFAPLALRAMLDWYRAAEEQSAAFALISELLDANCLDYGAARHECGQERTTRISFHFIM